MNKIQKGQAHPIVAIMKERESVLAQLVGKEQITRFMAGTLSMFNKTKGLDKCDPASFYAAAHQCAILKLNPGPLNLVYLIPYGQTATLLVGYKGLIVLARRHPDVERIEADLIYEDDHFEYDVGMKKITHHHTLTADTSDESIVGACSRVWLVGSDRPLILVLNREQIESRRARSKASQGNFWKNDYGAMARKTVIRAHCNGGEVPLGDDLAAAIDHELEEERKADVVSVSDFEERPPETMIGDVSSQVEE